MFSSTACLPDIVAAVRNRPVVTVLVATLISTTVVTKDTTVFKYDNYLMYE